MPDKLHLFDDIRAFLLDLDGTFYLGNHLNNGSLDFIITLDSLGISYLFLTNNSSRDANAYTEKLAAMGFRTTPEKILTSGEATIHYLDQYHPSARVYVVGTPLLTAQFEQAGYSFDAVTPEIAILGFDTTLTYNKLQILCRLVASGIPYLATHADINCPTEDGFIPDTGAMIALVKTSTGRLPDHVIGKPSLWMAQAAARKLNLPLNQLSMVGDRLYTDIALGNQAGIQAVLVLSGETHQEDIPPSPYQPDLVCQHLGELADIIRFDKRKI
jgi:4-nitrophenyl phosphatase